MKLRWHLLLVALFAVLAGISFIQEPGFGDDLTYWNQALEVHEHGTAGWDRSSFHDLRWPVWGICYVLQPIVNYSIASFYGEPIFYLTLAALLAFLFGKRLLGSVEAGWAGAAAVLFHPLFDSVCFRPMPDLSEGVLGAATIAVWWQMVNTTVSSRRWLWMLATGVLVYVIESNRVTGAFIVPVLIVNTLIFFRSRFWWLVGAGVISAGLYAGEAVFYHQLFGDWLHNIHANMNNVGNKGTKPMALWIFPIRFLDAFWRGNNLVPFYTVFALVGAVAAWRRQGVFGRVVVIWAVLLYLEYSCTPQPAWPIRPLIRDADRFLAGLAVPLSLLTVCGLWWGWQQLQRWKPIRVPAPAVWAVLVGVLFAATSRGRFDLGFVPEFRTYLRSLPDGTRVFTHDAMRAIAILCDADSVRRLKVDAPPRIMQRSPELEASAAQASEFWYARKLVWLGTRKALEQGKFPTQPPIGSYFETPEKDWTLMRMFAKGDTPDLIFYRRRTADTPPATVLGPDAPEIRELLPTLPVSWNHETGKARWDHHWDVPESLRGKYVRLEMHAGSPQPEAFTLRLKFRHQNSGKSAIAEYLLKPYLHRKDGMEFFVFAVPPDAERCDLTLKFSSAAKELTVRDFRALVETPH